MQKEYHFEMYYMYQNNYAITLMIFYQVRVCNFLQCQNEIRNQTIKHVQIVIPEVMDWRFSQLMWCTQTLLVYGHVMPAFYTNCKAINHNHLKCPRQQVPDLDAADKNKSKQEMVTSVNDLWHLGRAEPLATC